MDRHDEEILEALWTTAEDGVPTAAALRERCMDEVSDADLERLVADGLVTRDGDALRLTPAGEAQARDVVRRHRLAEALLFSVLDIRERERRERVACEVEHTLVPDLANGICTVLGHPRECPDGKPIPPGPCCAEHQRVVEQLVVSLADLQPGRRARVLYIKPKNHERLHRLTAFGLTPGVELELHQQRPAYCIRYEGTELALDRDVAEDIFVAPIEGGEPESDRPVAGHGRGRRRGRGWRGWGWGRRGGRRRG